jgi:hypothetical protein
MLRSFLSLQVVGSFHRVLPKVSPCSLDIAWRMRLCFVSFWCLLSIGQRE